MVQDTDHEVATYRTNLNIRKLETGGIINRSSADEAVKEMEEAISGNIFAGMDVQSSYSEHRDHRISITYNPRRNNYSVSKLTHGLEREEAEVERALEDAGLSIEN